MVLFCVVRARGAYVRSDLGEKIRAVTFPFPFSEREVFLVPRPSKVLSSQLQLALSILFQCSIKHEELS